MIYCLPWAIFFSTIQNNLARRVILHGGIATGRYVLDHKPLEGLNQLANITHCRKPKLNDTILCLQELPYDLILNVRKLYIKSTLEKALVYQQCL